MCKADCGEQKSNRHRNKKRSRFNVLKYFAALTRPDMIMQFKIKRAQNHNNYGNYFISQAMIIKDILRLRGKTAGVKGSHKYADSVEKGIRRAHSVEYAGYA